MTVVKIPPCGKRIEKRPGTAYDDEGSSNWFCIIEERDCFELLYRSSCPLGLEMNEMDERDQKDAGIEFREDAD